MRFEVSKDVFDLLPDACFGVVAVRGEEIVAGASGYSRYRGGIEIQIDTRPDLRRRGLDVLARIQQELRVLVTVDEQDFPDVEEVDVKLLKLAKLRDGCVLTTDYNLNKVAGVSGIQVLNINDLANALKPVALPGEEMEVLIVKEGKEQNQGVGYLDDGTMIVVEGGKQAIGQTVTVSVTSVLQTSAGRMIFAKMQE